MSVSNRSSCRMKCSAKMLASGTSPTHRYLKLERQKPRIINLNFRLYLARKLLHLCGELGGHILDQNIDKKIRQVYKFFVLQINLPYVNNHLPLISSLKVANWARGGGFRPIKYGPCLVGGRCLRSHILPG